MIFKICGIIVAPIEIRSNRFCSHFFEFEVQCFSFAIYFHRFFISDEKPIREQSAEHIYQV